MFKLFSYTVLEESKYLNEGFVVSMNKRLLFLPETASFFERIQEPLLEGPAARSRNAPYPLYSLLLPGRGPKVRDHGPLRQVNSASTDIQYSEEGD